MGSDRRRESNDCDHRRAAGWVLVRGARPPYYELTERGVAVTIASPKGGQVELDALSDPREPSKWSTDERTPKVADMQLDSYDALMVAGGLSPMFTYRDETELHTSIGRRS